MPSHRASAVYLSDTVVNAEPEEQQGAEEGCLEQPVQHAGDPAVHQEGQRKQGICPQKQPVVSETGDLPTETASGK